ncbi:MAG: hypothetical protein ACP5D2_01730 [Candidatus Nanoarchaeia archaeon]
MDKYAPDNSNYTDPEIEARDREQAEKDPMRVVYNILGMPEKIAGKITDGLLKMVCTD